MSLNSVVNSLVRAAAGVPADISDTDLDRHVAQLLAKEAKERDAKWEEIGLGSLITFRGRDSPDPSASKPNKRFLASVIRTVDGHNAALLRQQAEAARAAQRDMRDSGRGGGESSRASGSRLFGGAMRGLERGRDRDRGSTSRNDDSGRIDRRTREYDRYRNYKRDHERDHDRDVDRERVGGGRRGGMAADRLEEEDDRAKENRRERRRREREEKERAEGRERGEETPPRSSRRDDSDDDRMVGSSRRKTRDEDYSFSHRSRARDRDRSRDHGDRSRRDGYDDESDYDDRHHRRRERDSSRRHRARSASVTDEEAAMNGTAEGKADAKTRDERRHATLPSQSTRPTAASRPTRDRSRSPPPPPRARPERSRPRTPSPPSTKPPSPPRSPSPDGPPAPKLSKMDKYFSSTYDPRLDLGEIPKEGMVAAVGWDNMLAVLKERGKKRRHQSPGLSDTDPYDVPQGVRVRSPSPDASALRRMQRAAVAAEKSDQKKRKEDRKRRAEAAGEDGLTAALNEAERERRRAERSLVGDGDGEMADVMGMQYVKKGAVREWDKGK